MDSKLSRSLVVLVCLALSACVYALDEESAKEQKCFEIKKTVPLDMNWQGPPTMYYPLMSRLELYRTAATLTKRDFKDITEDELYYEGCIKIVSIDDENCNTTGFNGISEKAEVKMLDDTMEKVEFGNPTGWHGICYTTFSDNSTFMFQACCSNGNEMHWGVVSTEKVMSKENVKLVHDHAESLGFKREYFTALRYDSCDKE